MEPREKARYEEISTGHTITVHKKPSNAGLKAPPVKKTRRNQDEVELFEDRIVVSARESVTPLKPLKLGTLGTGLLKSQTNLDTKEMNLLH